MPGLLSHGFTRRKSEPQSNPRQQAHISSSSPGKAMSSTPMTPRSPATSVANASSSPPSSPPSAAEEDKAPEEEVDQQGEEEEEEDASYDPALEKAQAEEDRLQEQTHQEEVKRKAEDKSSLEKDGGKDRSQSLKDLDWFLERSQGFSGSVMGQLGASS